MLLFIAGCNWIGAAALDQQADRDGDGVDRFEGDCDDSDPEVGGPRSFWTDADGDGFGDPATRVERCDAEDGEVEAGGDCDDADTEVNPAATEVCNGRDDDCDAEVDDADASLDPSTATVWLPDADADGRPSGVLDDAVSACVAPAGTLAFPTDPGELDCDDSNATVSPGAAEVCDGLDNDCNALVDDAPVDATPTRADADGDGWPDSSDLELCLPPGPGRVTPDVWASNAQQAGFLAPFPLDCDAASADAASVFPGAADLPGDGIDQNCDGADAALCFVDLDGDGHAGALVSVQVDDGDCEGAGWSSESLDCDDGDPQSYPGAPDACDGIDQDCDGVVPDGVMTGWLGEQPTDLSTAPDVQLDAWDEVRVCGGTWTTTWTLAAGASGVLRGEPTAALPTLVTPGPTPLVSVDGGSFEMGGFAVDAAARSTGDVLASVGGAVTLEDLSFEVGQADAGVRLAGGGVPEPPPSVLLDLTFGSGDFTAAPVVVVSGQELEASGLAWTNTSGALAGAMAVFTDATATCEDCDATGVSSTTDGGALAVSDGSFAEWKGGTLDGCSTSGSGGGAAATDGSEVAMSGADLLGCTADEHGGALFGDDSASVRVTGGRIANNAVTGAGWGGGLRAGTVTLRQTDFENNAATRGGDVSAATVNALQTTHIGSSAVEHGGTFHIEIAGTIDGASLTGGTAELGGCVASNAVGVLRETTLTGCSATLGGAVYAKTLLQLDSVSMIGNDADSGGAIFFEQGALLATSGPDNISRFEANTATTGGAAIAVVQSGLLPSRVDFSPPDVDSHVEVHFVGNDSPLGAVSLAGWVASWTHTQNVGQDGPIDQRVTGDGADIGSVCHEDCSWTCIGPLNLDCALRCPGTATCLPN